MKKLLGLSTVLVLMALVFSAASPGCDCDCSAHAARRAAETPVAK